MEDVGALAPEAGYLLTVAFPKLSLEEANRILTETEGPGGGFLDDGSAFGVYSRLNLYAAARPRGRDFTQQAVTRTKIVGNPPPVRPDAVDLTDRRASRDSHV